MHTPSPTSIENHTTTHPSSSQSVLTNCIIKMNDEALAAIDSDLLQFSSKAEAKE